MAKSKSQVTDETPVVEDEVPAREPVAEATEPSPEAPAVQEEKPASKSEKKAPETSAEKPAAIKAVNIRNRAYAGQKVCAGSVVAEFDADGLAVVPAESVELFLRIPGFSLAE